MGEGDIDLVYEAMVFLLEAWTQIKQYIVCVVAVKRLRHEYTVSYSDFNIARNKQYSDIQKSSAEKLTSLYV